MWLPVPVDVIWVLVLLLSLAGDAVPDQLVSELDVDTEVGHRAHNVKSVIGAEVRGDVTIGPLTVCRVPSTYTEMSNSMEAWAGAGTTRMAAPTRSAARTEVREYESWNSILRANVKQRFRRCRRHSPSRHSVWSCGGVPGARTTVLPRNPSILTAFAGPAVFVACSAVRRVLYRGGRKRREGNGGGMHDAVCMKSRPVRAGTSIEGRGGAAALTGTARAGVSGRALAAHASRRNACVYVRRRCGKRKNLANFLVSGAVKVGVGIGGSGANVRQDWPVLFLRWKRCRPKG